MRKIILISILALFAHAAAYADVKEHVLKNGLKVLMVEDHKTPIAVFQVWYRVGSKNEPSGKTGMSHLLEHMMFKGTPSFGSKVFSKKVQKAGGVDNAYTSKDQTVYWQKIPSSKLDISIELEADRMLNLTLDPAETIAERNVVMEERRMRTDDDPQSALYEELLASSFIAHPYHNPVIGWMYDIASISRDDLYAHYKNFYAPNNAFIIVSGDIDSNEVIKKIERSFGSIPVSSLKKTSLSKEPEQKGERRITLKKEAELPVIMAAYHAPSLPDPDAYALEVLSVVLSGGKSGRLYKSLVYDKKIALSAYADYSAITPEPFLFMLGATVAPGKDAGETEKLLFAEVDKIIETPPTEHEVQKCKNQIESSFVMSLDSVYFQAEVLGMFEVIDGWRGKDKYIEGIRKVTPEDVRRVAKKYLRPENRTVAVLIPQKEGK